MPDILIKCPHCGGERLVDQNEEFVKCQYCHKIFPLKESKTGLNDQLQSQINDAIIKRNKFDFNEATIILEDLVSTYPDVAEIYFQLLLSDYGVSYVSEDSNITEKPVISSVQKESIFSKEYYHKLESILSELPATLKNYKERLEEIEKLREESIKTMKEIEPFDVFICYKRTTGDSGLTWDSKTADKLYRKFNDWGLNVFYAEDTLYHRYAGKAFEPVICSALLSAKLFVLVCATPDHKEYLLAPWVKNEWARFKKRMENEVDVKLRLLPVFDNGFTPDKLPRELEGIEGIKLDDEFDSNVYSLISSLISKEKKSKFNDIKVQTNKVGTLSVKKEEIVARKFTGFKEKELNNLERTDFNLAVADMKINNNNKYKAAYKKLCRLTETNKFNFEANLAKLKCNFKIPNDDSLVNTSLWRVDDIQRMNNDFLALMEAGGEDCARVRKAMVQMLKKSFSDNPTRFASELKKEESTFLTIAKTYEDKNELFEYAKDFEKPYFDLVNNKVQNTKIKNDVILNIANKLFRRIYSNYEEKGARQIFDLYRKSFMTLSSSKSKDNKALVDEFINLALEINKLDVDCLWYRFCFDLDDLGASEWSLAKKLKKKNYAEFNINKKNIDDKLKEANLYYFMIKAIESGYKMDFISPSRSNNYFNIILRAACIMTNKKKNKVITRQIFNLMASLTGSGSTSDENTIALLMRIGNRLLLEKRFKEARRYYEEVLNIDEANCDARWGLVKCDIKKPSNYSILFYRKSLNDLSSYRMLVAVHEEKHPNQVNHYLAFYEAIENIKNGKGKEKRNLYKAFRNKHNRLMKMDNPYDTPVEEIIISIGNGTLIQEAKKAPKTKSSTPNVSSYSFAKERVQVFFNILLLVIALAAVILLKPESAYVVLLGVSIVAALMARFGYGHLTTGKNPYKPLLIVFGILSVVPFIVINVILHTQQSTLEILGGTISTRNPTYDKMLPGLIWATLLAVANLIVTIVRKTKPSSSDCDCSNVYFYYLLSIMTIYAAAMGGYNLAITYFDTGRMFGFEITAKVQEFMNGFMPAFPAVLTAVTPLVLRLFRGSGL